MPDISDLLAAEAARQQPARVRAFAEVMRSRRGRDRRNWAAAGAVLVLALAFGLGGFTLLRHGPGATSPSGSRSSGGDATVTGVLLMVGGPSGATPTGVGGTVYFRAASGAKALAATADARPDGQFNATVPPGDYVVTGTSPTFGDGRYVCHAEAPVTVTADGLDDVRVLCVRR